MTKEVIEENGLKYDPRIADISGMTQEDIESALIRIFVAQNKTMEDYSEDEIKQWIMDILLNKYNHNLLANLN